MVVAPRVLVKVGLEPLGRYRAVDATQPTLDERPEPLDGLGVDVPVHVDLRGVLDAIVSCDLKAFEVVVDTELVGEDGRGREQVNAGESRRFDQGGGRL